MALNELERLSKRGRCPICRAFKGECDHAPAEMQLAIDTYRMAERIAERVATRIVDAAIAKLAKDLAR